jgi:aminoglycoside phosphotransferase (APT) family kinase protein
MGRRRRVQRVRREPERDASPPWIDGWVEWGGQRIWAVDWTSSGFPIGLSEEEMREIDEREKEMDFRLLLQDRGAPAWRVAKAALEGVIRGVAGANAHIDVGRIRCIGEGLSHEQYAAHVEIDPDPSGLSGGYAVGLPLPGADRDADADAHRARERAILELLPSLQLPFRVPRILGEVTTPGGVATVRTFERGLELDLRAGRQTGVRPWLVIGGIAAAVHSVPLDRLPTPLPGFADRRAFAESQLARLQSGTRHADVARSLAWARAHLPEPIPCTLIHGDLLGQNILLDPGAAPTVIDWEYCGLGDPAYDLAVVTRGVRRPFQIARGLERLLEAYRDAGGEDIQPPAVQLYEVCIAARAVCDAMQSRDRHIVAHHALPLQSLLRRLTA